MEIREAIQRIAGENRNTFGITCTVVSVDGSTCVCSPIDGSADIEDVRLQVEEGSGIFIEPRIGSFVIVAMTNDVEGYVALFSEIETIIWMDGTHGGLVRVVDLVAKLNALESKVNALITWGVTVSPPFSPSTLLPLTDRADLENTNITHGNP